jgi:small subunit ribosomal protein S21
VAIRAEYAHGDMSRAASMPQPARAPAAPIRVKETTPVQVLVRDNNVDQALRVLKKKMQREGVFREMKRRRFYEKPSERTTRERAEAVRRMRKLARKRAQREGLAAAPKRKKAPDRTGGRFGSPTARPSGAGYDRAQLG